MVSTTTMIYPRKLGDMIAHHHPYCEQHDPQMDPWHVYRFDPPQVASGVTLFEPSVSGSHDPYVDWQPEPQ